MKNTIAGVNYSLNICLFVNFSCIDLRVEQVYEDSRFRVEDELRRDSGVSVKSGSSTPMLNTIREAKKEAVVDKWQKMSDGFTFRVRRKQQTTRAENRPAPPN